MKYEIDWESIYAQVPDIMGLPDLRLSGRYWYGPYYLDGSESSRRDKMVIMRGRKGDGMITVSEQGGQTKTLISWLIEFGGVSKSDVFRVLSQREHRDYVKTERHYTGPQRFVERWRYIQAGGGTKMWANPLFWALAGVYGKDKVTEIFWRYGVTDGLRNRQKGITGTRFWYINRNRQILFDKTMFYKENGHRDKDLHPIRQYKISDGYSKICYFGEHLIADDKRPIMVVESEKSAIICALEFPEYHWVACGGLKCLKRLEGIEGHKIWLVPDIDGVKEWEELGPIWKWWEKCKPGVVKEKWDLADLIMYKYGK